MNLLICLSIIFALSEFFLAIVKHAKSKTSKTRGDKGSMIIMWLSITLGFTAGFFLAGKINQFWYGFGFVFIVTGLIIRWVSILQLGKSFTVNVAITDSARLKTDGLYERIRHPSYTGLLAVIVGFAFVMSSVYSFIAFVVPVFFSVLYRINIEEKILINEFGDSYLEYKSRTKRLIPGIY